MISVLKTIVFRTEKDCVIANMHMCYVRMKPLPCIVCKIICFYSALVLVGVAENLVF